MDSDERRMNPMAMTITNPLKEIDQARDQTRDL